MTPEQAALLATVREKPDDDIPRMVYADWLTESGFAEWADLIRCQCRLANPDAHGIALAEYVELEAEHFRRMESTTLPDSIPGLAEMGVFALGFDGDHLHPELTLHEYEQPDAWMHVRFRRGIIVAVRGPLLDVRKHLPNLLLHHALESAVPTDVFGDDAQDRELPRALDLFIDRWVSDETMTDEAMTNMPIYFSKVLIAEAMERMERGEA